MRGKSVLLLVLALGCGLVASIGISQVMDRNKGTVIVEETEKVQVYVAKVNLPPGEEIKADQLKIQQCPKELAEDAVTKLDDIVGQRPGIPILANDMITKTRMAATGKGASGELKPGHRLVWVKMTAEKGGNLVRVGDRVDVQVFIRQGATPQITSPTTKTFLQNIRVFAVNTKYQNVDSDNAEGSASVVGLEVTPKQGALVTTAQRVGEVSIVLRNATDTTVATKDDDSAKLDEILNLQADASKSKPKSASASGGGFTDWLAKTVEAAAANAKTPAGTPLAGPGFSMISVVGSEVQTYTFNDVNKPPLELANSGAHAALTLPTGAIKPTGASPSPGKTSNPTPDSTPDAPKDETKEGKPAPHANEEVLDSRE